MKPASFRSFVLATLVAAFACGGATAEAASTSGFRMRLELTLNTALAETEITTGVPALVRLSESTISGFKYDDFSLAKGGDMMFTDAAGNELPFEVDTWNPSGESLVWVRIPSTAANTVIKMYYGNGATPSAASTSVWSDYVGVWHLNDTNATDTAHSYGEYPNSTATDQAIQTTGRWCAVIQVEGRPSGFQEPIRIGTISPSSSMARRPRFMRMDAREGRERLPPSPTAPRR